MATETTTGSAKMIQEAAGSFLNGHAAMTIIMWIKSNNTYIDRGFLHSHASYAAGNDESITARYDASGASSGGTELIKFCIDATCKTNNGYESASYVQTTALQCLVMSWESGGQEELWIDGVLDTPGHRAAAYTGVTVNNTYCDMHRGGKDGSDAWDGVVYKMTIFNRKLSFNELRSIVTVEGQDTIKNGRILEWQGDQGYPGQTVTGDVTDRSGNDQDGTPSGSPTFAEDAIHTRRRRAA